MLSTTTRRLTALGAVAVLALAACGGDEDEPAAGTSPSPVEETSPSPAPEATPDGDMGVGAQQVAATFAQPEDGATVTSPVQVEMQAAGVEIAPTAAAAEGAGHFHIAVDTDCVPEGQTIPKDESHQHFGDGSTTTTLELEPGEHTLCLQVGDNNHVAVGATHTVTITVQ